MRYNLVSVKACLDHLGSSRACRGSGSPRWFYSLAASLVLDTCFPWGFGRARDFSGVRSGTVSFVHQLRSVLSPLFSPSNEDGSTEDGSTVPGTGTRYRVHGYPGTGYRVPYGNIGLWHPFHNHQYTNILNQRCPPTRENSPFSRLSQNLSL